MSTPEDRILEHEIGHHMRDGVGNCPACSWSDGDGYSSPLENQAAKPVKAILMRHRPVRWDSRVYNEGRCNCGFMFDTTTTDIFVHLADVLVGEMNHGFRLIDEENE